MNNAEIKTPWGEIGYIVHKRTYARRLDANDPNSATEEFPQTVDRVITACNEQLGCDFNKDEQEELEGYLLKLKGSVAGRFWWQLGTETVNKLGLLSLQNCAYTNIDEPIRPFTWVMDALMLGCGVGYSIQRKHVYQLPKVKESITIERVDDAGADFIVPDTREGWVKLLGKIMKAHFLGGKGFTYSCQMIRSKGAPIGGFGGIASGPDELVWGMQKIHEILNSKSGEKLEPIDCLDIMNIIGKIVVAGNVRRSAQIAIGDYDDVAFLQAKSWDLGNVPNWRAMSNNSVICSDTSKLPQEFWDTYEKGEPYGLINIELAKICGRLGETQFPDPDVEGFNPCAEQSLADKETCCLAELFLPNIESQEELIRVASYLYRINKHSLALPCHLKESEAMVHKNMRMGIGITGVMQATAEQRSWLDACYRYLRAYDVEYSEAYGWPVSIKLTTVKPSGSLSLLAGVTPGGHPSPAGPFYIRRVRIANGSPLVEVCKKNGFHVEQQRNFDGTNDNTTMVVSFPCKVPKKTPIAGSITAIEQLEGVVGLQRDWSDNSVSVTVYYTLEELPEIKEWLNNNYTDNLKTVSFLLTNDHGFDQAPYETISEDRYNELVKNTTPITSATIGDDDMDDLEGCLNGACPVK